jgi:uncharacterized protein (DUF1499 family)
MMITDFPLDFARFAKINKPNQFLALPANFTAVQRPDATVGTFTATIDQVRDAWLEIVRGAPRVSGVRQLEGQIECIQRTKLVGFPDWVTAMPVDLGNGQASICVFSRSKYGLRDFGVNQTRGLDWLAQLASKLPPKA